METDVQGFYAIRPKICCEGKTGPCLPKVGLALSTSKRESESPYLVLSFVLCKYGCNNRFSSPTGLFWGATVTSDHISYCWSPVHVTCPHCLMAGPTQHTPIYRSLHFGSLECVLLMPTACPHFLEATAHTSPYDRGFHGLPKIKQSCPQPIFLFYLSCFMVLHRTYFFCIWHICLSVFS